MGKRILIFAVALFFVFLGLFSAAPGWAGGHFLAGPKLSVFQKGMSFEEARKAASRKNLVFEKVPGKRAHRSYARVLGENSEIQFEFRGGRISSMQAYFVSRSASENEGKFDAISEVLLKKFPNGRRGPGRNGAEQIEWVATDFGMSLSQDLPENRYAYWGIRLLIF